MRAGAVALAGRVCADGVVGVDRWKTRVAPGRSSSRSRSVPAGGLDASSGDARVVGGSHATRDATTTLIRQQTLCTSMTLACRRPNEKPRLWPGNATSLGRGALL